MNNTIASVLWYSAIFGPTNLTGAESLFPSYFGFGDGGSNSGAFYGVGDYWYVFPQGRNVTQGQVVDDLSIVKGSHTLKVGGNFRRNRVTDYTLEENTEGAYYFASMVDFANGTLSPTSGSSFNQNFSPQTDFITSESMRWMNGPRSRT